MKFAKELGTREELAPQAALDRLVAFERIRAWTNQVNVCVWCGKPANSKRYPDVDRAAQLIDEEAWYRACSTAHADRFTQEWTFLANDIVRPWWHIESARSRHEKTIAIDEWPFNLRT